MYGNIIKGVFVFLDPAPVASGCYVFLFFNNNALFSITMDHFLAPFLYCKHVFKVCVGEREN